MRFQARHTTLSDNLEANLRPRFHDCSGYLVACLSCTDAAYLRFAEEIEDWVKLVAVGVEAGGAGLRQRGRWGTR